MRDATVSVMASAQQGSAARLLLGTGMSDLGKWLRSGQMETTGHRRA